MEAPRPHQAEPSSTWVPVRYAALAFLALLLATAASPAARAESPSPSGRLTIVVPDLDSDDGNVVFALFDSQESFEGAVNQVRDAFVPPNGRRASVSWDGLPFGEYALRIFHDVNDNREIDTNWVGIPKEPFGFSNEARGRFGPPRYDQTRFRFDSDGTTLTIRLQRL